MLLYGDCLEVIKHIDDNSIDMILCVLPYGTTKCSWDILIPFDQLWNQYNRIAKRNAAIVLFGTEPFLSYLRLSNIDCYKCDFYWKKERVTNIFQLKKRAGKIIETISVFYKYQPTYNPQMIQYTGNKRTNKVKNGKLGTLIDSGNKKPNEYVDNGSRFPTQLLEFKRDILTSNLHPTQKSVALLENLIKTFTNENDVVLDNCMGSGSTAIACINTKRKFIGIEKDPTFYQISEDRIKKHLTSCQI